MTTKGEWDRLWSKCEYATYFHSREWAEIWQTYSDGNYLPSPYLLKFSDGTRAIFPLTWHESQQRFVSSPAETYGGLLSLDPINNNHTLAAAEFLPKAIGSLFVRVNPFSGTIDTSESDLPLRNDETLVLCLNGNFESIYNDWSKNHKVATKRARKEGITVGTASSLENWCDYYRMYESSLKRWGDNVSSRYGWELFEAIFSRNSKNIKLWLAWHEGQPIAGALCFYSKRHAVYWHGAAFGEYFKLKPVQLLFYEAIRDAVDNGYFWFDFNPSGGHEGVKTFKQGFGTAALSCPWVELEGQNSREGWRNDIKRFCFRFNRYVYENDLKPLSMRKTKRHVVGRCMLDKANKEYFAKIKSEEIN
ncbi:MAG: GNAT family N-acetyltransferase [Deltaproteobacteria bacterium]|nr:GNAT family N-acetyltransferase [Deltaproteobacteria bacterium]